MPGLLLRGRLTRAVLLCALLAPVALRGAAGAEMYISTYAGTLPAAGGRLALPVVPASLALDGPGRLLISDDAHSVVWLENLTSAPVTLFGHTVAPGEMAVVAGNGGQGYSGDGQMATTATLDDPVGLVTDRLGNLYIADWGNNRVRKVLATSGVISTVAGTGGAGISPDGQPAARSQLHHPIALSFDTAGDLFIADSSNNRVSEVVAPAGVMVTVAGTGQAGFAGDGGPARKAALNTPVAVALDSAGDLFIADSGNGRVREVMAHSMIIRTVLGTSVSGDSGDGGPASHAQIVRPVALAMMDANHLLIDDYGANRVRIINLRSFQVGTLMGTGHAAGATGDGQPPVTTSLPGPISIATDTVGNVFVATAGDTRVRVLAASVNLMLTVATTVNPTATTPIPARLAVLSDPFGAVVQRDTLYLTDWGTNSLRAIDLRSGRLMTVALPATLGGLLNPAGIASGSAGTLYVADSGHNRILSIVGATVRVIAGTGASGYSGDGGAASKATLRDPLGVAVNSAGDILVADTGNNVVRVINRRTGVITTTIGIGTAGFSGDGGPAQAAQLRGPSAVAVDSAGNIFVSDTGNNRVREVAASAGIIFTAAGTGSAGSGGAGGLAIHAQLHGPLGLALDAANNLYIADAGNNRMCSVLAHTGTLVVVAGTGQRGYRGDGGLASQAQLSAPSSVAVDGHGALYVADTLNNRVRLISPTPPAPQPTPTATGGKKK